MAESRYTYTKTLKGGKSSMGEFKSNIRRLALEQNAQSLQSQIHNASDEAEIQRLQTKLKAIRKTLAKLT